ncbi:hypothetical protein FXO38_09146 [Capsicum annuum]|nr:hypothetical protein FXO38_09146 [Capsicum annuum]
MGDHIDVVAGDHLSDNVVDDVGQETVGCMKDGVEHSQEIDWSVISDSEISKYTQPDKIFAHSVIEEPDLGCKSITLEATNIVYDNVVLKIDTEVLFDVGSVRKNVDDISVGHKSTVILDDTLVVPRRRRKPAAVCESPYVSKLDSGFSNVQGQPTKCIDKGHSRKHIFSIKHPFTNSITKPFLDMKFYPVHSESVNNLSNAFDFGVVTIKTKEWFYTLGYAGVSLTDQVMIEGVQIPTSIDDIDSIQSRYGVSLWQYGKRKQMQCAINDAESTGRLKKKNESSKAVIF